MNFAIVEIPGLQYIPNYLTAYEQDHLMDVINQQTWLTDLKRRVQHYGYRYDYKTRRVHENFYLGPLPNG